MKQSHFYVVALAVCIFALAAPAFASPDCDHYDSGALRPPTDPSPDPECGGVSTATMQPAAVPGSLTTLFSANNSFAGNTFDIEPKIDLDITGFDVNLSTGSATTIAIYWRNGTALGAESSSDGWTLLGKDTVTPNGINIPTHVNIGGLELSAGNTYGFYVDVESYPSSSIQYTNGGPTTFSNDDMDLTTFHGKGNPAFTGANFYPRQWNGTVYYEEKEVPIPTLSQAGLFVLLVLMAVAAVFMRRRRVA